MMLINTLLLLSLFSFLSMQALESSILSIKTTQQAQSYYQAFYRAEAGLREAEKHPLSCLVQTQDLNYYSKKNAPWWRTQTCTAQMPEGNVYYVVEAIGTYPCTRLSNAPDFPVDYFRVSSWGDADDLSASVLLQTTFAAASTHQLSCEPPLHFITPGRQSWRVVEKN